MDVKKRAYLIISVILSVLLIIIGVLVYLANNDRKYSAKELAITNITDTGVSVTWFTDEKSYSTLLVRKKGEGLTDFTPVYAQLTAEKFYDDRDMEQNDDGEYVLKDAGQEKRFSHHVSLRGLSPETEYEFAIAGKVGVIKRDDDGEKFPSFKTFKIAENLKTPDPVYSRVLNLDRTKADPVDGIVYYQLVNPGDLQVSSAFYSTTLNGNSSWAGDLSNVKSAVGDEFKSIKETIISVSAKTEVGKADATYLLDEYKPLASLFIGGEESDDSNSTSLYKDGRITLGGNSLNQSILSSVSAETDEECSAKGLCGAGGACYPDQWCCADNYITQRTYQCVGGSWFDVGPRSTESKTTQPFGSIVCSDDPDDPDPLKPCKDDYTVSCSTSDGQLGTKTCHKEGTSPCGVSGSQCSWDPAKSSCGECVKKDTRDDYLLQMNQEQKKATQEIQCTLNRQDGTQTTINYYGPYIYQNVCYKVFGKDQNGTCQVTDCPQDIRDQISVPVKTKCGYYIGVNDEIKAALSTSDYYPADLVCIDEKIFFININASFPGACAPVDVNDEYSDELSCTDRGDGDLPNRVTSEGEGSGAAGEDGDKANQDSCLYSPNSEDRYLIEHIYCFGNPLKPYRVMDPDQGGICDRYQPSDVLNNYSCDDLHFGDEAIFVQSESMNPQRQQILWKISNSSFSLKVFAQATSTTQDQTVDQSGGYSVLQGDVEAKIGEFAVNVDDVSGKKVNIKLYYDLNANGVRDEGEEFVKDLSDIKLRKDTDAATYNLQVWWNLIAIPLSSSDGIDTASKLIDHFNSQDADVVHVAKYTDTGFVMYSKREDSPDFANDFNLIPGEGYFVLNYQAANVNITGNKFDEAVPFRVRNGWNLVGVYTNEADYAAEELLKDMQAEGITADTVSKYDSGLYTSVVYDDNLLYGNDYNIYERQGYFVRVATGGADDKYFTPKPGN